MVCFRYIVVNTLYKGDNKDNINIIIIIIIVVVVVVVVVDLITLLSICLLEPFTYPGLSVGLGSLRGRKLILYPKVKGSDCTICRT
jgi:hypothetical protein